MTLSQAAQSHPLTWPWYIWAKVIAVAGLPLCWAGPIGCGVALHAIFDFTLQSDWVAVNKGSNRRALALHALLAGGFPFVALGWQVGGPGAALVGLIVGVVSHYTIDGTRKFGVKSVVVGLLLDQCAHVACLGLFSLLWR